MEQKEKSAFFLGVGAMFLAAAASLAPEHLDIKPDNSEAIARCDEADLAKRILLDSHYDGQSISRESMADYRGAYIAYRSCLSKAGAPQSKIHKAWGPDDLKQRNTGMNTPAEPAI